MSTNYKTKHTPGFLKSLLCECMCVQSLYMAFAINITNGRGLSNEAHHELLLKKSKVMLY